MKLYLEYDVIGRCIVVGLSLIFPLSTVPCFHPPRRLAEPSGCPSMLVLLGARAPPRRAGSATAMLAPPAIEGIELELADGGSITEVAAFFVDSFWAASTTYDKVELSGRERGQLTLQMAEDFHHRYANSWLSSGRHARRFFGSRLLVARGAKGEVVGCVGLESALLDPFSRTVHAAAAAEKLMAIEFDCMVQADVARYAELHKAEGLPPLARELYPELTCLGLLTNLAVAPSRRRSGLGRALCAWCEAGCAEWALPGLLLQVEAANGDARALYARCGFDELFQACACACACACAYAMPMLHAMRVLHRRTLAERRFQNSSVANVPTYSLTHVLASIAHRRKTARRCGHAPANRR